MSSRLRGTLLNKDQAALIKQRWLMWSELKMARFYTEALWNHIQAYSFHLLTRDEEAGHFILLPPLNRITTLSVVHFTTSDEGA